jgi:hypothetical protein
MAVVNFAIAVEKQPRVRKCVIAIILSSRDDKCEQLFHSMQVLWLFRTEVAATLEFSSTTRSKPHVPDE